MSFNVTVADDSTTKPAISDQEDIEVEAKGPGGSAATFDVTAKDLVDGAVGVHCLPGIRLPRSPLGVTPANCEICRRTRQ